MFNFKHARVVTARRRELDWWPAHAGYHETGTLAVAVTFYTRTVDPWWFRFVVSCLDVSNAPSIGRGTASTELRTIQVAGRSLRAGVLARGLRLRSLRQSPPVETLPTTGDPSYVLYLRTWDARATTTLKRTLRDEDGGAEATSRSLTLDSFLCSQVC